MAPLPGRRSRGSVLSQDAGGAIRGPGRADIFWGRGPDAALAASHMKESGDLDPVVPKVNAAGALPGRQTQCCAIDATVPQH